MKITRVICCLFLLLLSLVAFAFTTSAPRAHAASGTTFIYKLHGLSVSAFFDSFSPDGCIETTVAVGASQSTVHKQTSANVFIGQFDSCTNALVLDALGPYFPDR